MWKEKEIRRVEKNEWMRHYEIRKEIGRKYERKRDRKSNREEKWKRNITIKKGQTEKKKKEYE